VRVDQVLALEAEEHALEVLGRRVAEARVDARERLFSVLRLTDEPVGPVADVAECEGRPLGDVREPGADADAREALGIEKRLVVEKITILPSLPPVPPFPSCHRATSSKNRRQRIPRVGRRT